MTDPRFLVGAAVTGPPEPDDLCLAVVGRKLVVAVGADGQWRFPTFGEFPGTGDTTPLGTLDGVRVWGAVAPSEVDSPYEAHGWIAVAERLPTVLATVASRALQVMTWRRTHRYCGACTHELVDVEGDHYRRCPGCDLFVPMQLSPAVLTLVRRGTDEVLLVRHTYGPTALWALVAGFVEAGESLEEAVVREVAEEVGLTVEQVAYFGSQPWAMSGPGVLLAGFTAVCADGSAEAVVDGKEIAEARWFRLDDLPANIPPPYSISRWLIDAALRAQ